MHPREPIFPVHRHRVMKIRENEKTEHCQHFQRQKFGSKRRKDWQKVILINLLLDPRHIA